MTDSTYLNMCLTRVLAAPVLQFISIFEQPYCKGTCHLISHKTYLLHSAGDRKFLICLPLSECLPNGGCLVEL